MLYYTTLYYIIMGDIILILYCTIVLCYNISKMAARIGAAAHGSSFQCSFWLTFSALFGCYGISFSFVRFCDHPLHPSEPFENRGPAPDTYYECLSTHAQHPRRDSETVDCHRVSEAAQSEEGEEAEVGLQVRRHAKAKETTTHATSAEPVPLQCQIIGA